MPNSTRKPPNNHVARANFHDIIEEAREMGFDEAVLVLSRSDSEGLLVRFHATSLGRAATILKDAELSALDKIERAATGPSQLANFIASHRGKVI